MCATGAPDVSGLGSSDDGVGAMDQAPHGPIAYGCRQCDGGPVEARAAEASTKAPAASRRRNVR